MWPAESFRCTMSKEPWCFSLLTITPTRPVFFPPLYGKVAGLELDEIAHLARLDVELHDVVGRDG